jgi:hypothetical protein
MPRRCDGLASFDVRKVLYEILRRWSMWRERLSRRMNLKNKRLAIARLPGNQWSGRVDSNPPPPEATARQATEATTWYDSA